MFYNLFKISPSRLILSFIASLFILFASIFPFTNNSNIDNSVPNIFSADSVLADDLGAGSSGKVEPGNLVLLGYDFGVPNYEVSFLHIIGFLLYLASQIIGIAGFLAIIYIMIGGITLVLSGGNEEQAQKGKKTLTYAIAGFILAVAAFIIVNTFLRYIIGVDITELPTKN